MKPLNVMYLIRTWAMGGSHTIIRHFLHHLPKDEFNIITVPYDAPGTGAQDFVNSCNREGLEISPERIPWNTRLNWFKARAKIIELITRHQIDLIHCHDTLSNVMVGVGRRHFKCAAVASPYGWWDPKWNLKAKINHWVEKNLALPNFERVYTVSHDMKRKILEGRTREDRIRVIHTGLELSQFKSGAPREQVRAAFSIPPEAAVIGTVSRLFAEKGHKYLLSALRLLADEFPNVRVMIVGTGDERQPLEALAQLLNIEDKVIFTGFYNDLPGALRAMDIFAQPSILDEGFPTSVLEAQAAGLPVVASDIGGTHETIDVGVTGLLTPPKDAEALAKTIRELVADPARRATMAAAAPLWIERSFTLQQMIEQISATYHEAYEFYHVSRS